MGNTSSIQDKKINKIEMKILSINSHGKNFIVNGDKHPSFRYDNLILKRDNLNFLTLFNKIKSGVTCVFLFTFPNFSLNMEYPEIIDIIECCINSNSVINKTNNKVYGCVIEFLSVDPEYKLLSKYTEIVIGNNNRIKLLMSDNDNYNIVIGEKYIFDYNYLFCKNFYKIIGFSKL
jgi:hypothetical protein